MSRPNCGIYKIENTQNGHLYIGSSVNLLRRKRDHFVCLKRKAHPSGHLQGAYNKYGEDSFKFSVLLLCEPFELLRYEQALIDKWHPEYNISPTAGSCLGCKASAETKKKLSDMRQNRTWSEETKQKISESHMGLKASDETRKKLSDMRKGMLPTPGFTGRKHSEETKNKIAEKSRQHMTEDMKKKLDVGRKAYQERRKGMFGKEIIVEDMINENSCNGV